LIRAIGSFFSTHIPHSPKKASLSHSFSGADLPIALNGYG
jgi:hypothetical protein